LGDDERLVCLAGTDQVPQAAVVALERALAAAAHRLAFEPEQAELDDGATGWRAAPAGR
jgi:hypothetical protein